jgi:hypothetical protein
MKAQRAMHDRAFVCMVGATGFPGAGSHGTSSEVVRLTCAVPGFSTVGATPVAAPCDSKSAPASPASNTCQVQSLAGISPPLYLS